MAETQAKTTSYTHDREKSHERQGRSQAAPEALNELIDESATFVDVLADPGKELPADRHVAMFGDARFSHPANISQKALMMTQLQKDYGNGYVQRVLDAVQASRQVSSHGNCQQGEANDHPFTVRLASDFTIQPQTEEGKGMERVWQTKPAAAVRPGSIQREAEKREGEEEEAPIQTRLATLQEASSLSVTLEARIGAARDSGQPLDDSVRASVEPRLGSDLGYVRVHADTEADQLTRKLNAKAFTTGRDVFFREGYYQPVSPAGRQLLAHELTHVAQQSVLPRVQRQRAAPRARPRYRLVANLGTAQLTVFNGRNKVREMPVIFGRATLTLLRHRGLRIGHWRERFTTPSRTDYTACTWFKWGKELDRFPPVAFSGTGTAGTGVIKVGGRRYRVGTIVPGRKGEIYRHEPDWLRWETIEKYSNPFGKYATVIRGNFMLHGTDGEDGLGGGPFAGLTPAERAKVTHGCIRTSNADIEWLKDNVPARTRIQVRR